MHAGRRRARGFPEVELLDEPVAAALAYIRDGLQAGRRLLAMTWEPDVRPGPCGVRGGNEEMPCQALPPAALAQGGNDFDLQPVPP